jgi:hypothetical protein
MKSLKSMSGYAFPTTVLASASALHFSPGTSAADTFRCGPSIIDTGMIAAEVVAKCGEPNSREVTSEPIRARRPNGSTYIVGTTSRELWIFERDPGQFRAHLTFEQGRLTKIELLDRR